MAGGGGMGVRHCNVWDIVLLLSEIDTTPQVIKLYSCFTHM